MARTDMTVMPSFQKRPLTCLHDTGLSAESPGNFSSPNRMDRTGPLTPFFFPGISMPMRTGWARSTDLPVILSGMLLAPIFMRMALTCLPLRRFTVFFTDAALKRFWNYPQIRSGSARHPVSFRFCIHGIKNWITMFICTALFPAAALPEIRKSVNPLVNSLFLWQSCGISSRVNIWHFFSLRKRLPYLFFFL